MASLLNIEQKGMRGTFGINMIRGFTVGLSKSLLGDLKKHIILDSSMQSRTSSRDIPEGGATVLVVETSTLQEC